MNIPRLRPASLALVAGFAVWSTSTCAAANADTTRSMKRLPAASADKKAREDLLSILQPTGRFTTGNRIRISGIAMDTVPYGAGFKGLCRRDELVLVYGSTVKGKNSVDDPLRPVGVDAERQFHVTQAPVMDMEPLAQKASWDDGGCRKLRSDTSASWFSAPSDLDAAKGVNVFLAAMTAMRTQGLKAKDCHLGQNGQTCEAALLELGQVGRITAVDRNCGAGPYAECFQVMATETVRLTIVASFVIGSVEPAKVESVSVSEFVTVT